MSTSSIEALRPKVERELVVQHALGMHAGVVAQYGTQIPYQCPICKALKEAHRA